ncbi:unnamed protein product [Effrenium voratum]|uniref:C3H1-type domain-containing protein n=1 Tax=Effrenium voratum TaxID=2562239 RepID=A0AA36N085_9DINO|nr:unnamed protein product [Effrenium voratum]
MKVELRGVQMTSGPDVNGANELECEPKFVQLGLAGRRKRTAIRSSAKPFCPASATAYVSSGESTASGGDSDSATEVNPGSVGHPWLCKRPCVHVAAHRGICPHGSNCSYCHLSHPQRRSNFDKRQREFLRSLNDQETLTVLLPQLRVKAAQMSSQAYEVVELVEKQLEVLGGVKAPEHLPQHFTAALEQMNFAWLITISPCKEDPEVVKAIELLRSFAR